ncbi:MAG: cell division protein ZapA [Eubacteriales bacterium]|nr:cell division protein ZapA [Clostridiales bacterium]MDD7307783.1 cell division protein ZapA [Eubacteriales bacterium]MDY2933668.1 cell division protein ZapA [Anaerovoracaceae bacterium]MEE0180690.1 cell division protein ZapA [Anaerovoracaceae bacterium]
MENNKVKIRIYGQEYTIVGERSQDEIIKAAQYVDERMQFIGRNSNLGSTTSLAVLSAVNIADEIFSIKEELEQLRTLNAQLEADAKKYVDLWDDAKKNVIQYRNEIEDLRKKASDDSQLREIQRRYKELESSFFDLQMENVQLKSRLDKTEK